MKRCWIEEVEENDGIVNNKKLLTDSGKSNTIPISDDVFCDIIFQYIPLREWPKLEQVSRQFQRVTFAACRSLQNLSIGTFFYSTKKYKNNSGKLQSLLAKFAISSPNLKEINGFCDISSRVQKNHFLRLQRFVGLTNLSLDMCTVNVVHFADCVKNFTNLTHLSLAYCTFTVTKHVNLSQDPYIEASALFSTETYDKNFVNAEIYLKSLSSITALHSLDLSEIRQFTGKFLHYINADSLKVVNFNRTLFHSGYVCEFLRKCSSSLEYLDLTTCSTITNAKNNDGKIGVTVDVLRCLPDLSVLRSLILVGYVENVDNFMLEMSNSILKCKELREICLVDNLFITKSFLVNLVHCCPELEILRINMVKSIVSASLCNLTRLSKLKMLGFYASRIIGKPYNDQLYQVNRDVILRLPQFELLESLNLGRPVVSPTDLKILSTIKNLKKIRMSGICATNELIIHWCTNLKHQLIALEIPNCVKISNAISTALALCTKLKTLNLNSAQISDLTIQKLAAKCLKLEQVDVTQDSRGQITEKSLIKLLHSCTAMKILRARENVIEKIRNNNDYSEKYKFSVELIRGTAWSSL